MNAARVRIWARPKNAPHLRVEVVPAARTMSPCMRRLMEFARNVADFPDQPDAVLACAFRRDGEDWEVSATWQSDSSALPMRLLPIFARESVLSLMTRNEAITETMDRLGYQPVEDPSA